MVRAAASGAIDYSQADPDDLNWRLRHKLLLKEVRRQEEKALLDAVHAHWLGYLSHGSLTPDSFKNVRKHTEDALQEYQEVIFPWTKKKPPPAASQPSAATAETEAKTTQEPPQEAVKPEQPTATIDEETAKMIEAYKQRFGDQQ